MLIVDDESDITKTTKKGLELLGFSVDTFNDPVEAMSKFKPGTYDLVILDIKMPKMNGFELCKEITKIDSQARICFITAFEINPDEFRKVLPKIKAECFIKKPIGILELAELIKKSCSSES